MNELRVLAGEWVLPVAGPPVRDGAVVVEGTRIAWVGPRRELPSRFLRAPLRAFPRGWILPGWVNAHSHLNFTPALGLVPGDAARFTDWMQRLLRLSQAWPPSLIRQGIQAGLDLLASSGTTTVAHLSTLPELEPFLHHPVRSVVFHELVAFPAAEAGPRLRDAEEWLDAAEALRAEERSDRLTFGIAPHAPYSVSQPLLEGCAALAGRRGLPLSIHLAETEAEAELLRTGSGPFRALHEARGDWDPSWRPPGVSPVQFAAELGLLDRPGLAVHVNYLSDEDVALLAKGRLVPVWCPGSHQFFGHAGHPAARLCEAGAPVALGTDSLASNIGLNMLREVRLAAELRPDVPREAWIEAATLRAAQGLGLGRVTGSLEPGKAADLQVLEGPAETTADPLGPLFEAPLRVRAVFVDGAEVKVR